MINTHSEPQNNELGQVWTPFPIASRMVSLAMQHLEKPPEVVIDPAVGPATFIKAMFDEGLLDKATVYAYDSDFKFTKVTRQFMKQHALKGEVSYTDYLLCKNGKADLVIMNPPYVRHERIPREAKNKYAERLNLPFNSKLNGRSNLYIYFLLKGILDTKPNGILCAIIYDAIKHSQYGQEAMRIIQEHSNILEIINVTTPFRDVLVDATILVLKRNGNGDINAFKEDTPDQIPARYTLISNLVNIKRGVGLLNSSVFMARPEEKFYNAANYFIKKSSRLNKMVLGQSHQEKAYIFEYGQRIPRGLPGWLLEKAKVSVGNKPQRLKTLLNVRLKYPNEWFFHKVVSSKIIFNYYIRKFPKYILNPFNLPIADNFYAIEPKDFDYECAWVLLNSKQYQDAILKAGRPQGNGLMKIQVYEYKKAIVPDWRVLTEKQLRELKRIALTCQKENLNASDISFLASKFVKDNLASRPKL